MGYVDRGGSKTYSSGAFDFRANFVSLVLFQAAYVWIKFRQAARPGCRKRKAPDVEHEVVDIETCNLKGVYARPIREKSSSTIIRFKYEPRFIPPRQEGDDSTDKCSKRLPLGEYHTPVEAQIVLQTARYYYDKDGGCVELEDGQYEFFIPPMSEQEQRLAGKEKRKWVTCTAKQVGKQMYADFLREKARPLAIATKAGSHGAEFNDPSSSTLPLPCSSLPMLTTMAAEPVIASTAPSSPSLPLLPFDGAVVGDAYDFSESLSGFEDMCAELLYVIEHDLERELNSIPNFQQGRDLADVGTENIDGRIFLQQNDPVLQQVVFCQKCLEDNARQSVHLDQLKAYEIQISKLQEEKERLCIENESLKSRLQQVARSQVATWTGIMMEF